MGRWRTGGYGCVPTLKDDRQQLASPAP